MNQPSVRPQRPQRIVVVGGGFSGAMSTVNIARLSEEARHITVVNDVGPGGASRTDCSGRSIC